MVRHLFRYHHHGKWWQIDVYARDADDAQDRMNKMPHAQYLGEIQAVIPARFGWWARLFCWWKNYWRPKS